MNTTTLTNPADRAEAAARVAEAAADRGLRHLAARAAVDAELARRDAAAACRAANERAYLSVGHGRVALRAFDDYRAAAAAAALAAVAAASI